MLRGFNLHPKNTPCSQCIQASILETPTGVVWRVFLVLDKPASEGCSNLRIEEGGCADSITVAKVELTEKYGKGWKWIEEKP
jgi:hypothetical protein